MPTVINCSRQGAPKLPIFKDESIHLVRLSWKETHITKCPKLLISAQSRNFVQGKHSTYQMEATHQSLEAWRANVYIGFKPITIWTTMSTKHMLIVSPDTSFIFISVHILQPLIALRWDWILCADELFDT